MVSYVLPDCRPHSYIDVGAGNAIFPLLEQNCNPELHIHAFDYSSHAVKLVQVRLILHQSISTDLLICCKQPSQHNALYISPPCGTISAAVWDLSSAELPPGLAPHSADILVLVFVLSALHPSEWPRAISNIAQVWKPFSLTLPSTSLDDSLFLPDTQTGWTRVHA